MPEKQIDCIRVGEVKARKKNWKFSVRVVVDSAVEAVTTVMTLVGVGCFIGIGLGGGLALATALWL